MFNIRDVHIFPLIIMSPLQVGTTLSHAEQVSSSSSSLQQWAHVNLPLETLLSRGLTTSSISEGCCPQQGLSHLLLSSACSVAIWAAAVMWKHTLKSIETRSNQQWIGRVSIVCESTDPLWRRHLEVWRGFVVAEEDGLEWAALNQGLQTNKSTLTTKNRLHNFPHTSDKPFPYSWHVACGRRLKTPLW